ncbi:Transducin/WD40 repeat-like superfamily protein [Euphorbia peplus]|nr:Transducin/WD40 repeat-like superfamily protein [Euphorbia peplus]
MGFVFLEQGYPVCISISISCSATRFIYQCVDLGPYTLDFTSSGRYIAVAGRKGHLTVVDMKNVNLIKEMQVRETV